MAVLGTTLHLVAATRTSFEQVRAAAVGAYDHVVMIPGSQCASGGVCATPDAVERLAREAGAQEARAHLELPVRLAGREVNAILTEAEWTDETHPERYRLIEGRWPQAVTEIAVPPGWPHKTGETVTLAGGGGTFTVVGIVDNVFVNGDDAAVYGAPGSTSRVHAALARRPGLLPSPSATIRFTAEAPDEVLERVIAAVARTSPHKPAEVKEDIAPSFESFPRGRTDTWVARLNAMKPVLGWGPLVMVPLVFAWGASGIGARRFSEACRSAEMNGLPRRGLIASGEGLWMLGILGAGGLALVAGDAAGMALRGVLEPIADSPLSAPMPVGPLVGIALGAAVLGVLPTALTRRTSDGAARRGGWAAKAAAVVSPRRVTGALALGAAACGAWLAVEYPGLSRVSEVQRWAVVATVACALAAGAAFSCLTDRKGRLPRVLTMALRRANRESAVGALTVAVVVAASAVPLSVGVTAAISQMLTARVMTPPVLEGQVRVTAVDQLKAEVSEADRKALEAATGMRGPVHVRSIVLWAPPDEERRQYLNGTPSAVESAEDLERLIQRALTPREREVFHSGGILVPEGQAERLVADGQEVEVEVRQRMRQMPGQRPQPETSPPRIQKLVSTPLSGVVAYRADVYRVMGFVSMDAVRRSGWEIRESQYVYTDQPRAATDAAKRAHLDGLFPHLRISTHRAVNTSTFPPEVALAHRVLTGLLVVVMFGLSMHIVAETRPMARALDSIGLGGRARAGLVFTSVGLMAGLPALVGHVVALAGAALAYRPVMPHDNVLLMARNDVGTSLAVCLAVALLAPAVALAVEARRR
ncbi:hypothetical protein [Falsarthrobacter nasiphocae]